MLRRIPQALVVLNQIALVSTILVGIIIPPLKLITPPNPTLPRPICILLPLIPLVFFIDIHTPLTLVIFLILLPPSFILLPSSFILLPHIPIVMYFRNLTSLTYLDLD
jgi:hypothetical protein